MSAYLLLRLVHGIADRVGIYSEENPTSTGHFTSHWVLLARVVASDYATALAGLLADCEGHAANYPGPVGAAIRQLSRDDTSIGITFGDVIGSMRKSDREGFVRALAQSDAVDTLYVEADRALAQGRTDATRWHNPDDVAELNRCHDVMSHAWETMQERKPWTRE
jgi:hypothetical protein